MADIEHSETTNQPDSISEIGLPALSIDWELYGQYLDESDLSEADKRAFIEALWSIMVSFVDMGFRLGPVPDICENIRSINTADGMRATKPLFSRRLSFNVIETNTDGFAIPCTGKEPPMVDRDITPRPKAVIYARVSSAKQTTRGDGLSSQETRCREYARYKGYEVIKTFADDMSGSLTTRPSMQAMLGFLRQRSQLGTVVIIDDISRLARGIEAHLQLRTALIEAGGKLESPSIEFGEDSDSILVEKLQNRAAPRHSFEELFELAFDFLRTLGNSWILARSPLSARCSDWPFASASPTAGNQDFEPRKWRCHSSC